MAKLNLLEYYSCNKTSNINEVNALSLFLIANNLKIYCYCYIIFLSYLQTFEN